MRQPLLCWLLRAIFFPKSSMSGGEEKKPLRSCVMLHVFYLKSYGSKIGTTKGKISWYPSLCISKLRFFWAKCIFLQINPYPSSNAGLGSVRRREALGVGTTHCQHYIPDSGSTDWAVKCFQHFNMMPLSGNMWPPVFDRCSQTRWGIMIGYVLKVVSSHLIPYHPKHKSRWNYTYWDPL